MTGAKHEKLASWWVWFLVGIAIVAIGGGFIAMILWAPVLITDQGKATPDAYLKGVTDNRTALVQAAGGFAVFLGVVVGFFTLLHNRQQLRQGREDHESDLAASRKEHEESLAESHRALTETLSFNRESLLQTVAVTERGQITDRFSKAIQQLGETDPKAVDLRLGGIYALERIARDSEEWRQPVIDVLAAFVRQHIAGLPIPDGEAIELQIKAFEATAPDLRWTRLAGDVAGAIEVLGRREQSREDKWRRLELDGLDCCRIDFPLTLRLPYTSFNRARMQFCRLWNADLSGSFFVGTELQGAELIATDLRGAHFYLTNLNGADLEQASMQEAELREVDLSGVRNLTIDQLKVAIIGEETKLPRYINRAELDAAIAEA